MRHRRIVRCSDIGRQILRQTRLKAGHRVRAYAHELVHAGQSAQECPVADMHVAAQRRPVRHDGVAADLAIVRDMHVGHDPVVVADARDAGILHRAGIEGAEFAYRVVVADLQARRLAGVFLVLRDCAHRTELEDAICLADAGVPLDDDMRPDHRPGADLHMLAYDGIRAHLDIAGKPGVRMDDRSGVMRHGTAFTVHISSASAASWPSTSAVALNLNSPRMLRTSVALMINWSPGPTGCLNRAPSIPAK